MAPPRVLVHGPAYLDRVLMVDRPLRRDPQQPAIDRSAEVLAVDPRTGPASTLTLDHGSGRIRIEQLEPAWTGPTGLVRIQSPGLGLDGDWTVAARSWHDDLGGMGAGYAKAMGGILRPVLGDRSEPSTIAVEQRLYDRGVSFEPIHRPGRASDWTLLVSSGPFGDKLPVGFRGILSDLAEFPRRSTEADLLVVASLSNRLVASALQSCRAAVRVVAPSIRNMLDRDPPLVSLVDQLDVLCLNRGEWMACPDREAIADRLAMLVITDGPNGVTIQYRTDPGSVETLRIAAFPRSRPPVDTNRAGETLASTLLLGLWESGWRGGSVARPGLQTIAERASAAAALQLDWPRFGFPDSRAIDQAVREGRVS